MPRRLWPIDCLHLAFFAALLPVQIALGGRMAGAWWWLVGDVAVVASVFLVAGLSAGRPPRRGLLLRLLQGLGVMPLAFTQVGLLITAGGRADYAADLEKLDRRLFLGTNPVEAVESLATPWLTEVMQAVYAAYLLLPVVTILLLILQGRPAFVARSVFSLLGIFYLSYLGYALLPASGPNIHNNFGPPQACGIDPQPLYFFATDLPGRWIAGDLRSWMFAAELSKFDCFPSGHTAVALACLVYAVRLGRGWRWLIAPVAVGVILSTVYLRYHYVVDVLAGLLLGAFGVIVLDRLHRRVEPALFGAAAAGHGENR